MHEYSIVQALIERVAQEAAAHPGAVVRRLELRVGELAGVEVDLLTTAFETFREGTCCAQAGLRIERVAVRWECPGCAAPVPPGTMLRCPTCARPARLAAGDELHLDRIEMEREAPRV